MVAAMMHLLNGASLLLGLVSVAGLALVLWLLISAEIENRRVLRDGSFERTEAPDPLPTVVADLRRKVVLATTSGRRIYTLDTRAREPNGTGEEGLPYYPLVVAAFARTDGSFPDVELSRLSQAATERDPYDEAHQAFLAHVTRILRSHRKRGVFFVATDGWAACREGGPASSVKLARLLDQILSSVEESMLS